MTLDPPSPRRHALPLGAGADAWLAHLRAQVVQPPVRPRQALHWQGLQIGSVEPALCEHPRLRGLWQTSGTAVTLADAVDLSQALDRLAIALRDAGLMKAWRNEQLAVISSEGTQVATVERGAVRLLGMATEAVHLAGWHPDGRFWIQQRAFDKSTDPGLWDTLVGGMVPAGEPLEAALARETWEEAGLVLADLQGLAYGGCIVTERPANELPHGHVVERLHWYTATVPEGLVPVNQDGEVAQFRCATGDEVAQTLRAGSFTLDAALILAAACGSGSA